MQINKIAIDTEAVVGRDYSRRLPEPGPRKGIKIEFQVVALLVYRLLLGALNVRNRAKD